MSAPSSAMSPGLVVLVLTLLLGIQPVTTDLYLPALPTLTQGFGGSVAQAQFTLTALLLAFGVSQLVWGPLSDRFGRRVPLLVACSVTLASSTAIVLAPTIELLIAGRFVQALSAAAGMVIARAMISDLADGYAGVRALSVMMSIHAFVPVIGPVVGGVLATFLPWRGVLAVFASVVAVQLVVSLTLVRETLPPARPHRGVGPARGG